MATSVGVIGCCYSNRAGCCSNNPTKRRGSGSQDATATTAQFVTTASPQNAEGRGRRMLLQQPRRLLQQQPHRTIDTSSALRRAKVKEYTAAAVTMAVHCLPRYRAGAAINFIRVQFSGTCTKVISAMRNCVKSGTGIPHNFR